MAERSIIYRNSGTESRGKAIVIYDTLFE